jgi:anti-sigma B factor antagonist
MANLDFHERDLGGGTHLVALKGELDLAVVQEARAALMAPIEDGSDALVVDLSEATFIDSTMLQVLLLAWKALDNNRFAVICNDPAVLRMLHLTTLDKVLNVVSTLDEARDKVAATGVPPQRGA